MLRQTLRVRPFVVSAVLPLLGMAQLGCAQVEGELQVPPGGPVTYEAFGAKGDGQTDDLPAIVAAHEYANEHRLPVRSNPAATYHLGRRALTVKISTDTDWGTSKFIIDDSVEVEKYGQSLFQVVSWQAPIKLEITQLAAGQAQLDVHPPVDCWVYVENSGRKRFIRRGANRNSGSAQRDCFILRTNGAIEGLIDWDYDAVTRVDALPIDAEVLTLHGGEFLTIANQMTEEKGYRYWARNIRVERSNTVVEGVVHRITGEGDHGCPYSGFFTVSRCANVTLMNCVVTGHKTYRTIGAAGTPVSMGTYDISGNSVVNFTLRGVTQENICDRSRWGVYGSNFCKNITLEDCVLSRVDAHQGVSGSYIIRRSTLGHAGLNAIGKGTLLVEDSELRSGNFINLRTDYGSTWEGEVIIRNSRWVPGCGAKVQPYLISAGNDGQHDFGYPCYMPRQITIEGLTIDDTNHPDNYGGPYLFNDPNGKAPLSAQRPFAFHLTEEVNLQGVTTTSGLPVRVSPDGEFGATVRVVNN